MASSFEATPLRLAPRARRYGGGSIRSNHMTCLIVIAPSSCSQVARTDSAVRHLPAGRPPDRGDG